MGRLGIFITGLVFLFVLSSCKKTPDFTSIHVTGNADVYLTTAPKFEIVNNDETKDVEYQVADGILTVYGNSDIMIKAPKEIYAQISSITVDSNADAQTLDGLVITFADDIDITVKDDGDLKMDIVAQNITVNVSGEGDIELKGGDTATAVALHATDDADYNAYHLQAKDYTIDVRGNADAVIYATNSITGQVKDNADVKYVGDPGTINVQVDSTATFESIDN